LKIKGINRIKLINLRDEIDMIIDIIEDHRDITEANDADIVRALYLEKGNQNEIIEALNASGFKISSVRGMRNYSTNDISKILEESNESELSQISKMFYRFNKSKCGWKALVKVFVKLRAGNNE